LNIRTSINICGLLNICASKSPTSPSPKTSGCENTHISILFFKKQAVKNHVVAIAAIYEGLFLGS
jgi:hypothetical protein